ncbi:MULTISPECIES: divalent-cation tolerance protein CutA [Streptomyces]|uniref:divalent-cation tolerance protein CutA n=1 Tax=Streptomyces TaxID=1883 RepID=UPI000CD56EFE|nr:MULTISPECIES: divalent-cation tolerance protein CutA [Streptomyces]
MTWTADPAGAAPAATEVLVVTTTTDKAEKAEELAARAVELRLAACAQVGAPITSYYRWQGETQRDQEWPVVLKTTSARYRELETYLREAHDYDEPEIIGVPVTRGSPGYLEWVATETVDGDAP